MSVRRFTFKKETVKLWRMTEFQNGSVIQGISVTPETAFRRMAELTCEGFRITVDEPGNYAYEKARPTLPLFDSVNPALAEECRKEFG